MDIITFEDLGVNSSIIEGCRKIGWTQPTLIQRKAIPLALKGKDVIGLAETGSGKTGAYTIPLIQSLIESPQRLFAVILTPTRELAYQVKENVEELGKFIGLKCAVVTGGMNKDQQIEDLRKRPHIIVASPGRLLDHLRNTRGFSLDSIKYLVMDEADKVLCNDFQEDIDNLLKALPKNKKAMLFSATMTYKVKNLKRAMLHDPVQVSVSKKLQTVENLKEYIVCCAKNDKFSYLLSLLEEPEIKDQSIIIFCSTRSITLRLALMLRKLSFYALPIYGKLDQTKRLDTMRKFKENDKAILLATDVASRGLNIPKVDFIINYNAPLNSKCYIHRVGRTARAGKQGTAFTIVSQYDFVHFVAKVEKVLNKNLELYPIPEEAATGYDEVVMELERIVDEEMKTIDIRTATVNKKQRSLERKKIKKNLKRKKENSQPSQFKSKTKKDKTKGKGKSKSFKRAKDGKGGKGKFRKFK